MARRSDDVGIHWDRVARGWRAGEHALWRQHSDAVNGALVDRWLPLGRTGEILKTDLFDEFAGAGVYPRLAAHANVVVGIDVSQAIAASAHERYPGLEVVVANVLRLPFDTGQFDAVVSNSTLDHLTSGEEVATAMRELARVLRPGGRLVITLDNPLNPLIAARNRMPAPVIRSLRGVLYDTGWTCGPRRLRRLVEEAGLDVRAQTAILHAPRVVVAQLGSQISPSAEARWLGPLLKAERLSRWPTRYLTGHFVAALAVRPG